MPRQQAQHCPVPLQPLQGDVAGLTSGRRRLSVRVSHALHRGGGDAHGHGDPLPQNRGGQVHHRHVPEHPGVQLPPGTHTNKLNFKRLQLGGIYSSQWARAGFLAVNVVKAVLGLEQNPTV